jgi:hypothetical protein
MICGKVVVLLSNVLEIASGRIDDLDIACHVFIPPILTEIGECLVCNAAEVQLMVTCRLFSM